MVFGRHAVHAPAAAKVTRDQEPFDASFSVYIINWYCDILHVHSAITNVTASLGF
jgi:hypothetical protein